MVKSGDYKAAMRITDTIDWRRVHKADLLATVSKVYEKIMNTRKPEKYCFCPMTGHR